MLLHISESSDRIRAHDGHCFVCKDGSLVLLAGYSYRERGPGGVLEHSGARLGCLPVTVHDPNDQ